MTKRIKGFEIVTAWDDLFCCCCCCCPHCCCCCCCSCCCRRCCCCCCRHRSIFRAVSSTVCLVHHFFLTEFSRWRFSFEKTPNEKNGLRTRFNNLTTPRSHGLVDRAVAFLFNPISFIMFFTLPLQGAWGKNWGTVDLVSAHSDTKNNLFCAARGNSRL